MKNFNELMNVNENLHAEPNHSDVMALCLEIRAQLQLIHWQLTDSTKHELLKEIYDDFQDEMDDLVEMLIALYGPIKLTRQLNILNIEEVGDLMLWAKRIVMDFESLSLKFPSVAVKHEIADICEVFTKMMYKLTLT